MTTTWRRLMMMAACGVLTASAATAQPLTVIARTGPDSTRYLVGPDEGCCGDTQILTVSWTSANAYVGVSISARLYCNCGHFAVPAFLTTHIGPDNPPVGAAVYLVAAAAPKSPLPPPPAASGPPFPG